MADNRTLVALGAGLDVGERPALVEASFSGQLALLAPTPLALVTGTEGVDQTATLVGPANPLPVVQTGALPAGTNNVGDVDVVTMPADPFGLNADAAVAAGAAGSIQAKLRRATTDLGAALTALQLIDDIVNGTAARVQLQDGLGNALTSKSDGSERALSVAVVDSGGNQISTFGGSGGTAQADNTTFTTGTTTQTPIGAIYDDVAPGTVTENRAAAMRMSVRRELYNQIRDAAGNERGLNVDANGEISLGTIRTSIVPGTGATHLGKAINGAVGATDTAVASLFRRIDTPAATTPAVGNYDVARVDSKGRLYVTSSGGADTAAITSVAGAASSVAVLAANLARRGFVIINDSTAILYLAFGVAAVIATTFTYKLLPGESIERVGPCYTGAINGIWASATGAARVTELS